MSVSLADQLTAARRELAMRRRVYPGWIQSGRLTQERADHEIACMEAIAATIEKLKLLEEISEEMRKTWVAEHGPAPDPQPAFRSIAPAQAQPPAPPARKSGKPQQQQQNEKTLL